MKIGHYKASSLNCYLSSKSDLPYYLLLKPNASGTNLIPTKAIFSLCFVFQFVSLVFSFTFEWLLKTDLRIQK